MPLPLHHLSSSNRKENDIYTQQSTMNERTAYRGTHVFTYYVSKLVVFSIHSILRKCDTSLNRIYYYYYVIYASIHMYIFLICRRGADGMHWESALQYYVSEAGRGGGREIWCTMYSQVNFHWRVSVIIIVIIKLRNSNIGFLFVLCSRMFKTKFSKEYLNLITNSFDIILIAYLAPHPLRYWEFKKFWNAQFCYQEIIANFLSVTEA